MTINQNIHHYHGGHKYAPLQNRDGEADPKSSPGYGDISITAVASVAWVNAYEGQLDDNPATGGGLRVYPDASEPGGAARATVGVKVTLNVAFAGLPVYLKCFDADDPSTNEAPLDVETEGQDNLGEPKTGSLQKTTVTTDAEGKAQTTFAVTMQPGDNFRVAAQVYGSDMLEALKARQNDTQGRVTPGGGEADGQGYAVTPLLTVWRKLRYEVDSMGAPVGTFVSGQITAVQDDGETAIVTTDQYLIDDVDRFVPGELRQGEAKFAVVASGRYANFAVRVNKNGTASPHMGAFELYDDDVVPTDVPDPDAGALADLFAPAYITTEGLGAAYNDTNVQFLLNFKQGLGMGYGYPPPYISVQSSPAFWATHCLGGFQSVTSLIVECDHDPDVGAPCNGQSDRLTASVNSEVLREYGANDVQRQHVLGHEVGHVFGLDDEYDAPEPYPGYNGIMYRGTSGVFVNANLRVIRQCSYPSSRQR